MGQQMRNMCELAASGYNVSLGLCNAFHGHFCLSCCAVTVCIKLSLAQETLVLPKILVTWGSGF